MKNAFNVGDKVKIRADLKAESNVGGFRVAPEMAELAGVDAVITGKRSNGTYGIDVGWGSFTWSEEMFEPVEPAVERKTFETGAVRDTDQTKGRCDLMPLVCAGIILQSEKGGTIISDAVLTKIENVKLIAKKGKVSSDYVYQVTVEFLEQENYNALGRTDRKHFTHTIEHRATVLLELSHHFKTGAEKYGIDNWKKGIPYSSYIDSGVRHYLKHLAGMTDERHDIAFIWNMVCLAWTIENMPQMNDYKEE